MQFRSTATMFALGIVSFSALTKAAEDIYKLIARRDQVKNAIQDESDRFEPREKIIQWSSAKVVPVYPAQERSQKRFDEYNALNESLEARFKHCSLLPAADVKPTVVVKPTNASVPVPSNTVSQVLVRPSSETSIINTSAIVIKDDGAVVPNYCGYQELRNCLRAGGEVYPLEVVDLIVEQMKIWWALKEGAHLNRWATYQHNSYSKSESLTPSQLCCTQDSFGGLSICDPKDTAPVSPTSADSYKSVYLTKCLYEATGGGVVFVSGYDRAYVSCRIPGSMGFLNEAEYSDNYLVVCYKTFKAQDWSNDQAALAVFKLPTMQADITNDGILQRLEGSLVFKTQSYKQQGLKIVGIDRVNEMFFYNVGSYLYQWPLNPSNPLPLAEFASECMVLPNELRGVQQVVCPTGYISLFLGGGCDIWARIYDAVGQKFDWIELRLNLPGNNKPKLIGAGKSLRNGFFDFALATTNGSGASAVFCDKCPMDVEKFKQWAQNIAPECFYESSSHYPRGLYLHDGKAFLLDDTEFVGWQFHEIFLPWD